MTTFPDFYAMTIGGDLLRDIPANPTAESIARKVDDYLSLEVDNWLYEAGLPEDTKLDLTATRARLITAAWDRAEAEALAEHEKDDPNAYADGCGYVKTPQHEYYYVNASRLF